MKKLFFMHFILIFAAFIVLPGFFYTQKAYAEAENFARIKLAGVHLYKTPTLNESYVNMHFELPPSYFVKLLSDAGTHFYKAEYMNQIGYVKKIEVQPVANTPQKPYATATFRIFSSDGTAVRDAPFYASNLVTTLPQSQNILQYVGKLSGEEAIAGRGNVWYFCKTGNFSGYVYAGLCDMLSTITTNTEVTTPTTNPFLTPALSHIDYLNTSGAKIGVITAVMLPAFAVFFMLFIKFTPKPKHTKKEKFKRVKSIKPQYLYDDSEL